MFHINDEVKKHHLHTITGIMIHHIGSDLVNVVGMFALKQKMKKT